MTAHSDIKIDGETSYRPPNACWDNLKKNDDDDVMMYFAHHGIPPAHRLCVDCNENPATTDLTADQVVNDVIVSGMSTRCVPCAFKRTRRMVMANKIV